MAGTWLAEAFPQTGYFYVTAADRPASRNAPGSGKILPPALGAKYSGIAQALLPRRHVDDRNAMVTSVSTPKEGRRLQGNQNSFTPWPSERICGQSCWP